MRLYAKLFRIKSYRGRYHGFRPCEPVLFFLTLHLCLGFKNSSPRLEMTVDENQIFDGWVYKLNDSV